MQMKKNELAPKDYNPYAPTLAKNPGLKDE